MGSVEMSAKCHARAKGESLQIPSPAHCHTTPACTTRHCEGQLFLVWEKRTIHNPKSPLGRLTRALHCPVWHLSALKLQRWLQPAGWAPQILSHIVGLSGWVQGELL